jgi:GxxExxY protein
MELIYKDECYQIVGACLEVYNTLGSGFLEAIYQEALEIEFKARGIPYAREQTLCVNYKGHELDKKYVADFVCYDCIIVETKATSRLNSEHAAQTINYLKATGRKLGVLVNFGNADELEWKRLLNPAQQPQKDSPDSLNSSNSR